MNDIDYEVKEIKQLLTRFIEAAGYEIEVKLDDYIVRKISKPRRDAQYTDEDVQEFEFFWSKYPKKEAKKQAFQAFKKLSTEDRKKATMDSGTRFLHCDKRYIPLASSYLNGERFNDEKVNYKARLKLPILDEELEKFAIENGLQRPGRMDTYAVYRKKLRAELEEKGI